MFDTTIRFDGDRDVDVKMSTVSVSGGWIINDRWSVRAGVGAILDGELETAGGTVHDVGSGGLAVAGAEYRAVPGETGSPFVDLSLFFGWSWTKTEAPGVSGREDYSAADARLGFRSGWNIEDRFFPFLILRAFGGPVNWKLDGEDVNGSDIHHFQAGLGAAALVGPVAVFAEYSGLGEKAFSAGLSTSW
jgi:hypothetical protein